MMREATLGWLTARPIAHRGLHDRSRGIVENTPTAFAAAIAGNYAIECDLQITSDGEAVVFHDEALERLTTSSGMVKDHSAEQMKRLTIRDSSDRVQTLAELLAQVEGQVPLVIEIKSLWDGNGALTMRALDVLKSYTGPHCLMSFDPDAVTMVCEVSPQTPRGIVADRGDDDYYDFLPLPRRQELRTFSHLARTQPDFISFYCGELPFAPIAAYRAAGHPVISWTIRSPAQGAQALRHSDQITFEGFAA